MNPKELYLAALSSATKAIAMVKDANLKQPTPDTGWDVKTLAAHMLYELAWVADVISGLSPKEVGNKYDGDLIGGDLQASWSKYKVAAEEAVKNCDLEAVAHLSWRDASVEYYLKQAGGDQLIHSWDLSAALLKPVKFDEPLAQTIYDTSYRALTSGSVGSLFKPPLEVADGSNIQTRLLALFGRDINWPA